VNSLFQIRKACSLWSFLIQILLKIRNFFFLCLIPLNFPLKKLLGEWLFSCQSLKNIPPIFFIFQTKKLFRVSNNKIWIFLSLILSTVFILPKKEKYFRLFFSSFRRKNIYSKNFIFFSNTSTLKGLEIHWFLSRLSAFMKVERGSRTFSIRKNFKWPLSSTRKILPDSWHCFSQARPKICYHNTRFAVIQISWVKNNLLIFKKQWENHSFKRFS